jgi:hypothetical protein
MDSLVNCPPWTGNEDEGGSFITWMLIWALFLSYGNNTFIFKPFNEFNKGGDKDGGNKR